MENNHTTRFRDQQESTGNGPSGLIMTVFDGPEPPRIINLDNYGKEVINFGRKDDNDIVLKSMLVSGDHGRFRLENGHWVMEDKGAYRESGSTNGLIYNNTSIQSRVLTEGDFIRIDDGIETITAGVLFVFASKESSSKWDTIPVGAYSQFTIGRDPQCDIVLPHVSVSKLHAKIVHENGQWYIIDCGSTNGVVVNNQRIQGQQLLHEKDVIAITNSKLIFTSQMISYCYYRSGISVDTNHIIVERTNGKNKFITCDDVSVNIRPGELVAIIGGSGAGKSTLLNCMCGYLQPAAGDVYINGINLYQNFESLKKLIGYVPQSDIVYDNLTLYDMLRYTADLRLPRDTSKEEKEAAIAKSIKMVELEEKTKSFIRNLSGGQKKRASIAVELLSDPSLLFLDEPASGLDPGTERNLMTTLRGMADHGKTVILVTHSTLQLKQCDKIIFMGRGGQCCYFGSYEEAQRFFGVEDLVDVYDMITKQPEQWKKKYEKSTYISGPARKEGEELSASNKGKKAPQLPVLCSRYGRLLRNDKQRFWLLLAQAPILAFLIWIVSDGQQYKQYEMTKGLLFALSCSAFWVGMLNAIQEICKERTILKREYMTGLSLNSYVLSKIIVLGIMCLVQSLMLVGVFAIFVGVPQYGLVTESVIEFFITAFLTALASAAMGLFVSALFNNPDRAMTLAPILLMPQILFSGMVFQLNGASKIISWFAQCRWSMEAFGSTANLNHLPSKMAQELQAQGQVGIVRTIEDFYTYTQGHLLMDWGILIVFIVVFLILARVALRSLEQEGA